MDTYPLGDVASILLHPQVLYLNGRGHNDSQP